MTKVKVLVWLLPFSDRPGSCNWHIVQSWRISIPKDFKILQQKLKIRTRQVYFGSWPECDLDFWEMGLCLEVTNSHHGEYVHKIILKSFNINRRYRPDYNSYIPKILHINFVLSSCNFDGGPTFASEEENMSRDWENLDTTVTCLKWQHWRKVCLNSRGIRIMLK